LETIADAQNSSEEENKQNTSLVPSLQTDAQYSIQLPTVRPSNVFFHFNT